MAEVGAGLGLAGSLGLAAMRRWYRRQQAEQAKKFRRTLFPEKRRKEKVPKKPLTTDQKQTKDIKDMKKQMNLDTGTHIVRKRSTAQLLSAINASNHGEIALNSDSLIETTLSSLKYYNPSVPGTLTTAAGATGSFTKQFNFVKCHAVCILRNNYQVPVELRAFIVQPRSDNSKTPDTCYTDGLQDIGSPSATSPQIYFTDSPVFNKLYCVRKSVIKVLEPGQQVTMNWSARPFMYDPAYQDAHASSYKPLHEAAFLLYRITGVVGHNTSGAVVGTLQAGIDVQTNVTHVVKYQAGADLKQITLIDGSGTTDANSVVSLKPTADNLPYSLS